MAAFDEESSPPSSSSDSTMVVVATAAAVTATTLTKVDEVELKKVVDGGGHDRHQAFSPSPQSFAAVNDAQELMKLRIADGNKSLNKVSVSFPVSPIIENLAEAITRTGCNEDKYNNKYK